MPVRTARRFAVVLCAVLIAAAAPAVAFAAPRAEGAVAPARRPSVIVGVSDAARMAAVRSALERSGGRIKRVYRWNAFLVSAPLGMDSTQFSAKVRGIGGVRYAEGNSTRYAYATANDPLFPQQWGLPDIGAPTAWDSTEGSGVAVAVIDSGIDAAHPDLNGNVVLFKNYVNSTLPPIDDNNHGTHVAGIVAAIRNNAIAGVGTAPKAKVYALKVLDASGAGSDADVASAIRDAVDLTPCRILSMSLGGSDYGQVLADAVSYARSKGALVIAAAGNSNSSSPSYPAALPGVMGVGAVGSNNLRASFSNYGSANCDIVAPGVNILSTVLGGGTGMMSGTSMATPFVSGAAALVWAHNPSLDAAAVANLLQNSAQDLGTPGVDPFYGHGLVRVDLAIAANPPTPFTITASAGANGSISPLGAQVVAAGSNLTFAITPAAGYHVASVLVDGASVGAATSYTFNNVTAAHTISATFAINTFTIIKTAGANGSIGGATTVDYGSNAAFTITPAAGYHVASVLVDGASVGAATSYTFNNVTAAHTISATFAINTFTIIKTAGANGSIGGATTADYGSNAAFAITPAAGYHVADVLADGVTVGALTSYTFTNVTANHTISATFVVNPPSTFTITASAGAGGSITPFGSQVVASGSSLTLVITPAAGYHVVSVVVDGTSVGAVTAYTFNNVTAAHAVSATFAINTYTIIKTAGANGSIGGATTADYGSNAVFAITAAAGYHVADVLADGVTVGALTSYTFTNVTASHTISATFAINTFTITPSAGANGSISPSSVQTVNSAANAAFTITPAVGYHVADVLVDDGSVGAVSAYTFINVNANHTVAATFAPNTFTITKTAGANGSIGGATSADYGSDAVFTVTPAVGYHIADVLVDGVSTGAVASYTFSSVTANHTIAATFAINAPIPTTITIATSRTSASIGQVFILSGLVTPSSGMVGRNMHADVKKPGKTYWSYSSARTIYSNAGVASWWYRYTLVRGMVKGTYLFKGVYNGDATYGPSQSGTVSVVVR